MKKFIIILLAICSIQVNAQETQIEKYLNPAQIDGVCNLGNHAAVLAREGYRVKDNKKLFTLHYLDANVPTQVIAIAPEKKLADVQADATQGMFIFDGPEDIEIVYVTPTSEPAYVSIPNKGDYYYSPVYLTDMDNNGNLIMVRSFSLSEVVNGVTRYLERGIQFITVDENGEVLNDRMDKHDLRFSYELVAVFPTSQGMAYHLESRIKKKKAFDSKIVFCNNDGSPVGEYNLRIGEESYFPSDIIYDNGKYVLAGEYLDGNVFGKKKAEGLFVAMLNEQGVEQNRNNFDWENLKKTLVQSKRGDFIFNGGMRVLVEKIENNGAGYSILGESYYRGSGITPGELLIGGTDSNDELMISVLDFVKFDTDAHGTLTSVQLFEKEECNIMMEGINKSLKAVQMARLLKRYEVFPFRSLENNTISYTSYKAKQGKLAEMNLTTGEITEGNTINVDIIREEVIDVDAEEAVANSKLLSSMQRLSDKADALDAKLEEKGAKWAYSLEKVDRVFNRGGVAGKGFYYLENGKVLSYQIDPESYSVQYKYVK